MKKIIILGLVTMFLLTGCTMKNFKYYKNVSDTVLSFYNTDKYEQNKYSDNDIPAIEAYLSQLTHANQVVNINDYLIKTDEFYTDEDNTEGVWIKNNICYIKYDDLGLNKIDTYIPEGNDEEELSKKVICNNYYTILYASSFYPDYATTKSNLRYNYIYLDGNKTEDGYEFVYRSTYDGTGMKVTLIVKNKTITSIHTDVTDVNSYIE